MQTLVRQLRTHHFRHLRTLTTSSTSKGFKLQIEGDSLGIPVHPTWSVDKLLSSYTKPIIAPSTLKRLHELSALIPPDEGTDAHARLTSEMENLVKLVEAVKLVEVDTCSHEIPDGRIRAGGVGIYLSDDAVGGMEDEISGLELLRFAQRTSPDGLYLVDADRTR